ncbi:hypothetical protein [Auraticoccus monumenti]|uniref:Uncharacterized protein n=1 Tax=Auraticoccus monumenti TaxID=675864 RepID=A0A1G6TJM1_9ACTN|nr:hypothetical protein [Auraticoccus monumenti]SDD29241.1 hypothetical protein SAMN04489747_0635 [Auraticoccus monumenti]
MQSGLHVALAAWVHSQVAGEGFLACPELPVPLVLADFASPRSMTDLQRAWEFAQLTNGEVGLGAPARVAGAGGPLWSRHRRLLERMEFATRSWSELEDAELAAARAVLFTDGQGGFPVPSATFNRYQEYRALHTTMLEQGAGAAELTAVLAEWVVAGDKAAVESALATVLRLGLRSTRAVAERERLALHEDLLPTTADHSFAPTGFTPLSAVDPTTWLEGRATLDELDRALPPEAPRDTWDAWWANRVGEVRLRFVVLSLHRSWFTVEQYAARDWRLRDGEQASAGDGRAGSVPAYAARAYLVEVVELAVASRVVEPAPAPPPGRPRAPTKPGRVVLAPGGLAPVVLRPRSPVTRLAATTLRPAAVTKAVTVPRRLPTLEIAEPGRRALVLGHVQLLDPVARQRRLWVTEALLAGPSGPPATPPPTTQGAFLVGLGCTVVPLSPNPSPTYTWAP